MRRQAEQVHESLSPSEFTETDEKLKVTGQVTAAWSWQEDRALDGQFLFCMDRNEARRFGDSKSKCLTAGPEQCCRKGRRREVLQRRTRCCVGAG